MITNRCVVIRDDIKQEDKDNDISINNVNPTKYKIHKHCSNVFIHLKCRIWHHNFSNSYCPFCADIDKVLRLKV